MIDNDRLASLIRAVSDCKTEAMALRVPRMGEALYAVQKELTVTLGHQLAQQHLRENAT